MYALINSMNKICVCGNSMSHSASRCKACDIAWRKIRYLGKNNPFFGKKHSDETKHTISLANSGKKASEETRKKLSVIMKGNKFSLGKYHSIETRLKMSVAKKGVRFTDEHRKNMSGSSCGAWLGGKSFEPYTLDFTTRFKESIKKRDGSSCQLCNKTINELQKSNKYLVIHHINYDKLLSVKENCVSLCGRCHSITNHNREKWIIFFQSMLRDKYGYDYEHQKIVLTLNSDFR